MAFQPAESLRNRTFIGLIVAQFLAGFNDQAIHAASMFYAIHQGILTEAQAISLMPILFYAPWAIFCTLAGYLADRFSKTYTLVLWKVAEIFIALVALGGFYVGSVLHQPMGAWMVLATVFMMGTHAAFFAPAKYGAMPEILQPHVLSRGNGILESTTFLAAILGTVAGGLLSFFLRDREPWIGVVLLILALCGAAASFMIAYLPPANPCRAFPRNLFKPLFENLGTLLRSKPLILSVLGIAFFIFMVSYMRAAMYMHGQTRNPRWDEFKTSLVVATVALGVGLGAPLAGFLSGGKVELGLVPLGTLGMAGALVVAALAMENTAALVVVLVALGFCSGFYMVPLYTLLQHRAPKSSKGDMIATSNFINVTGAIAASVLFYLLVQGSQQLGLTPRVPQEDEIAIGTLKKLDYKAGRPAFIEIENDFGFIVPFRAQSEPKKDDDDMEKIIVEEETSFEDGLFELVGGGGLAKGDEVVISSYELRDAIHYRIRRAGTPLKDVFDNEGLPRYLFLGAALMALGILLLLCRQLPDFLVRSMFWLRALGRFRITVVGMHHLPTRGPVILATNCEGIDSGLQVVSATDRYTHFILVEENANQAAAPVVRFLAGRAGFRVLGPGPISEPTHAELLGLAGKAIERDDLLALTVTANSVATEIGKLLSDVARNGDVPILPVFCGPLDHPIGETERHLRGRAVRVVFGQPLGKDAAVEELQRRILDLGKRAHEEELSSPNSPGWK